MAAVEEFKAFLTNMKEEESAMWTKNDAALVDAFAAKYIKSADVAFIRPSGNPITYEGLGAMMLSEDIVFEKAAIVEIDSVQFHADNKIVIATYIESSKFSYKGTPNEDTVKWSVVFEDIHGEWKQIHGHRCSSNA